jgi:phosphatidyl-myo-inositol alpha-mannosyltransferase
MKIAQVTEFYAPWAGGISEHVLHLSRELRAQGHDVRILTGRHRVRQGAPVDPELERQVYRLGPTVRFPYNGGVASVTYSPGLPRRIDRLLQDESFDIVHIHNPLTPVLPLVCLDRSPAVNVGTFHSYHPTERMLRWWSWVLRGRLPRLHLSLAVSPAAQEAFQRYFTAGFEIVPNGIDLQRFSPNGHVPAANGEQRLLFVGQLVPKKGLPVLLEAFDSLLGEFPRLQLAVVGDGPLREACRRMLTVRTRSQVRFLGQLHGEALVEQYRSCDVFCAPSIGHESFGITLLEAMAAAKPIVAARIPGYSDVVRDGQEALLYASTSPRDLREALRRVVTDGGLRGELARRGRATAQAYGWPRVASVVGAHYERLLRARC